MVKKTIIGLCLTLAVLTACNAAGKKATESDDETLDAETSYAFGVLMGSEFKPLGLEFDYKAFTDGFKASLNDNANITEEDAFAVYRQIISESMARAAARNLAESTKFLEENAKRNGVITTESGLQYEVLKEGNGEKPNFDSMVSVNYEGSLVNGTVFDSSYELGSPAELPLEQIISGFTEGIQLMSPGGHYKLYVSPSLGYGDKPVGGGMIPANSVLIFDVELLEILD
jgi:FKBP-type peptidyl-prolyl cis-trans isomerase FkpA